MCLSLPFHQCALWSLESSSSKIGTPYNLKCHIRACKYVEQIIDIISSLCTKQMIFVTVTADRFFFGFFFFIFFSYCIFKCATFQLNPRFTFILQVEFVSCCFFLFNKDSVSYSIPENTKTLIFPIIFFEPVGVLHLKTQGQSQILILFFYI